MSEDKPVQGRGACLCGAVRYEVRGPLRAGTACHCDECRKSTGSLWHATAAYRDTLSIDDPEGCLEWYASSDRARRGFCRRCGASLFFDPLGTDRMAIAMGSLEKPTGLELARHIFIEEKGDYYEITGNVPRYEGYSGDFPMPKRE